MKKMYVICEIKYACFSIPKTMSVTLEARGATNPFQVSGI